MSKPWILVSPSSRGIGHALTRQLLQRTRAPVLATARRDTAGVRESLLRGLPPSAADRLTVVPLDVTDEGSVRAASERAADLFPTGAGGGAGAGRRHGGHHHLHLAFAIPGILRAEKAPGRVDYEAALETFRVNSLGPLVLIKWFGDFLPRKATAFDLSDSMPEELESESSENEKGGSRPRRDEGGEEGEEGEGADPPPMAPLALPPAAIWLNMSARVGSITDNKTGGWYSYRASKAAVNSLTKSFDFQLLTRSADKAFAMAYHPGTVKTELSRGFWDTAGPGKLFSPEFAAQRMVDVVFNKIGPEQRSRCWDWKGEEVPP